MEKKLAVHPCLPLLPLLPILEYILPVDAGRIFLKTNFGSISSR